MASSGYQNVDAESGNANDTTQNHMSTLETEQHMAKRKRLLYGGVAIILTLILIIVIIVATTSGSSSSGGGTIPKWPVMVATFNNLPSIEVGFTTMMTEQPPSRYPSLDGVLAAVRNKQNRTGVNNVDSDGQVTQSAMVMWGPTMESGSVANLYNIDDAVSVAYDVMVYSDHAILVGEAATRFAYQMGYPRTDLNNTETWDTYTTWKDANCNPNRFWRNVNNGDTCLIDGALYDKDTESDLKNVTGCVDGGENRIEQEPQGTVQGSIAVLAIDIEGDMSIASSAGGMRYKIAGRISDAAIPGSGGYIDRKVGGCVGTGAGDVMIRFAPAKTAVTFMKTGSTPMEAAQLAVDEVVGFCGNKQIIVLCLDFLGNPGFAYNENSGGGSYGYASMECPAGAIATKDVPVPC